MICMRKIVYNVVMVVDIRVNMPLCQMAHWHIGIAKYNYTCIIENVFIVIIYNTCMV